MELADRTAVCMLARRRGRSPSTASEVMTALPRAGLGLPGRPLSLDSFGKVTPAGMPAHCGCTGRQAARPAQARPGAAVRGAVALDPIRCSSAGS